MHRAYTASSLNPQVDLDRALHQALQLGAPNCSSESRHQRSGVFVSMFLMPDVKDVVMVPQVKRGSQHLYFYHRYFVRPPKRPGTVD